MEAIFCHCPELSSPPIKRGTTAQKIWKLRSRLARLENHHPKSPVMGLEVFVYADAVSDTLDLLEELGESVYEEC